MPPRTGVCRNGENSTRRAAAAAWKPDEFLDTTGRPPRTPAPWRVSLPVPVGVMADAYATRTASGWGPVPGLHRAAWAGTALGHDPLVRQGSDSCRPRPAAGARQ
jgi:hypothetical protein